LFDYLFPFLFLFSSLIFVCFFFALFLFCP